MARWKRPNMQDPAARALAALAISDNLDMLKARLAGQDVLIKVRSQQLSELRAKPSYIDEVLSCPDLLTIDEIAADYGMEEEPFVSFLADMGLLHNVGGFWLLDEEYAEQGYTHTGITVDPDDETVVLDVRIGWTPKGRLWLSECLREEGTRPLIEEEAEDVCND